MSARKWNPCWKLTGDTHQTRNGAQWGEGVTNPHGIKPGDRVLCTSAWYHGYDNAYLAMLLNPVHAAIAQPVLWEAEWRGTRLDDHGLKFGATEFRTIRVVPAPVITRTQTVAFAIFCAMLTTDEAECPEWYGWAAQWISGEDRSMASAASADGAAYVTSAAYAAYAASAAYAARAARAASAADILETAIAWALTIEEAT